MPDPTIEDLEEQTFFTDDSPDAPPSDIVSYNELRSCADLYRMFDQGILDVHPDFQRDFVWKGADQTRFIDSLIKQLPIPSMCFAMDARQQEWMVIDGLQRMSTIVRYLEGGDWRLSKLDDIDQNISGKLVAAIKTSDPQLRHYYSRVENLTVPITVLRCDFKKKSHMEYLFTIFHRLNTGGMKLNNQEIRNCIYGGSFNKLLRELDQNADWRKLNRLQPRNNYRFSKQEISLRSFAFIDRLQKYDGLLSKFLNTYMHDNRDANPAWIENKRQLFSGTAKTILNGVYGGNSTRKISLTVLEALMVGIGANVQRFTDVKSGALAPKLEKLLSHEEFSDARLREGLSKRQRVIDRLGAAIAIFSDDT